MLVRTLALGLFRSRLSNLCGQSTVFPLGLKGQAQWVRKYNTGFITEVNSHVQETTYRHNDQAPRRLPRDGEGVPEHPATAEEEGEETSQTEDGEEAMTKTRWKTPLVVGVVAAVVTLVNPWFPTLVGIAVTGFLPLGLMLALGPAAVVGAVVGGVVYLSMNAEE